MKLRAKREEKKEKQVVERGVEEREIDTYCSPC